MVVINFASSNIGGRGEASGRDCESAGAADAASALAASLFRLRSSVHSVRYTLAPQRPSTSTDHHHRSRARLRPMQQQPPDLTSLQAFLDASMSSDPLVVQPDDADTHGMSFADLFRSVPF